MRRRLFLRHAATAAVAARFGASMERAVAAEKMPPRIRIGQISTPHSHAAGKMEAIRSLPETYEVVGVVESNDSLRAVAEKNTAYGGLPWLDEEARTGLARSPRSMLRSANWLRPRLARRCRIIPAAACSNSPAI